METSIIVEILTQLFASAITLGGLFIGFRQFNQQYQLQEVEVKAEAANENATANKTMFDIYERMFSNRLEQDDKFIEMNAELKELKSEIN